MDSAAIYIYAVLNSFLITFSHTYTSRKNYWSSIGIFFKMGYLNPEQDMYGDLIFRFLTLEINIFSDPENNIAIFKLTLYLFTYLFVT